MAKRVTVTINWANGSTEEAEFITSAENEYGIEREAFETAYEIGRKAFETTENIRMSFAWSYKVEDVEDGNK